MVSWWCQRRRPMWRVTSCRPTQRSGGSPWATAWSPSPATPRPEPLRGNPIGGFPVFAGALALVLGALVTGSEYGWGTVKVQLTQRPSRAAMMTGQALALAVAALIGVLAQLALGAVTSSAIALG